MGGDGGGSGGSGGGGEEGAAVRSAIGTGSLSGNSSTCHHNCMLLKTKSEAGVWVFIGEAEGEAATAIRSTTPARTTTAHIISSQVEWDRPAV